MTPAGAAVDYRVRPPALAVVRCDRDVRAGAQAAGTHAGRQTLENEHVFVRDQMHGDAARAGVADVVELEERWSGDEVSVADRGQ